MIDPTEPCDFKINVRIPSSLKKRMEILKKLNPKINFSYEIKKFLVKFVEREEKRDRNYELKFAFLKKIGKDDLKKYKELKELAIKFNCKTELEDILINYNGSDLWDKMIDLVEHYENMIEQKD